MLEQCITSFVDGRARLRHRALRESATAEQLRHMLPSLPGVRRVTVNERTGSLLLEYDAETLDKDTLLGLLRQWGHMTEAPAAQKSAVGYRRLPTRLVNRGMLGTLLASLVLGAAGRTRAHALAGGVFLALNACHLWAVRKTL